MARARRAAEAAMALQRTALNSQSTVSVVSAVAQKNAAAWMDRILLCCGTTHCVPTRARGGAVYLRALHIHRAVICGFGCVLTTCIAWSDAEHPDESEGRTQPCGLGGLAWLETLQAKTISRPSSIRCASLAPAAAGSDQPARGRQSKVGSRVTPTGDSQVERVRR